MTVANNYAPVVTAANGTATVFSGSWNAISAANLVVQLLNTTTGVYTTIAQGVGANQYQVTSITATGFGIVFNTAPLSGNNVIISRSTPPAQTVPYATSRGFQGSVEEGSFDALTAMLQENAYGNEISISAPVGDAATNLILPTASLRAGYVLGFDVDGNVIVSTVTLAAIEAGGGPQGPAGPTGPAGTVVPWGIAGGTADALTVTMSPAVTSLTDGLLVSFRANAPNATTTPTLKANTTTARVMTAKGGMALVPGNITAQYAEYQAVYNLANTRWELQNPTYVPPATSGGMVLLSSQTITSSTATVSDTTHLTSAYSHYIWEISNLTSVTNEVDAYVTLQQGGSFIGGTSYLSSGVKSTAYGTVAGIGDNGTAHFNITGGVGGIGSSGGQGPSTLVFEFWNPVAVEVLNVMFKSFQSTAAGGPAYTQAAGYLDVTPVATTGIKLALSSGNIATCQANLYGIP